MGQDGGFSPACWLSGIFTSSCCGSQPYPAPESIKASHPGTNHDEAFVRQDLNLRKGILEATSQVGSRSWKDNQVAWIPDPLVLGLSCIIYLEAKKHCLPETIPCIATIFHLLFFFFHHQASGQKGSPAPRDPSVTPHWLWQPCSAPPGLRVPLGAVGGE